MRKRTRLATVLCWLLGSSPVVAQGMTWIVDQSSGPGSHFTDLPPAVTAASDGDTIIVRMGSYSGFDTDKALTLLGEGSVTISGAFGLPGTAAVAVTGLGPGKTFVAANLSVSFSLFSGAIQLRDNAGRVHLQSVSSTLVGGTGAFGLAALDIANCREVTVNGGSLLGSPGLRAAGSTVSLTKTSIRGTDAVPRHTMCDPAFPGIDLQDSTVYLSGTDVRGGDGLRFYAFSLVHCPAQPAIIVTGGALTVTGDTSTAITAGNLQSGIATPFPTPAVSTSMAATTIVDPTVTLAPTQGGSPVQGTATFRRVVSLVASGAPPGGVVTADVVSPAGDLAVLFVSTPTDPTMTPFGLLFIDPTAYAAIGPFVQLPAGRTSFRFATPSAAVLTGLPLALQVAHLYRATAAAELSNPAVVVLY